MHRSSPVHHLTCTVRCARSISIDNCSDSLPARSAASSANTNHKENLFMTTQNDQHTTITVPAPQPSLDDLDDIAFSEEEQAKKPVTEVPCLWWHNALPVVDADTVATGWHIKAGIDPDIDETMEGMGVQRYLVQHKRP